MSIHLMEVVPEVDSEYAQMAVMQAAGEKHVLAEAVVYRRPVDKTGLSGFETMAAMDDDTIRKMIKKVALADLIMSLTGADKDIKEALLNNLPGKLKEISEITVCKMESGLLPVNVVDRCRAIISDAFLEILREDAR
jgi:flagellar motor switch protein FliG